MAKSSILNKRSLKIASLIAAIAVPVIAILAWQYPRSPQPERERRFSDATGHNQPLSSSTLGAEEVSNEAPPPVPIPVYHQEDRISRDPVPVEVGETSSAPDVPDATAGNTYSAEVGRVQSYGQTGGVTAGVVHMEQPK